MDVGMICSIFSGIFFGFYWYTKRWERKEQKEEESRQISKQLLERTVASQRRMQQNIELAQLEARKHQLEEEKEDSDFIRKARYLQETARYNHQYQDALNTIVEMQKRGVIDGKETKKLLAELWYGTKNARPIIINTLSQHNYSLDDMRNGIMYTYRGDQVMNLDSLQTDSMANAYQSVERYIVDQQTNVYKRS